MSRAELLPFVIAVAGFAAFGLYMLWRLFRGEVVGWVVGRRNAPGKAAPKARVTVKRHATADPFEPEIYVQVRLGAAAKQFDFAVVGARELAGALEKAGYSAKAMDAAR